MVLLHRIRHAMGQREAEYLLSGLAELDATYFGGLTSTGKRGRGTEKPKAIVAVFEDSGANRSSPKIQVLANLRGKTIGIFALDNIHYGSIIQSDDLRSYRKPLAAGYSHRYEAYDPASGFCIGSIRSSEMRRRRKVA